MSTSYTTRAQIGKPANGDSGWDATLNAALDRLDGLAGVGPLCVTLAEVPSASLNVAVSSGTFVDSTGAYVSYAGTASFAIDASSTRYVWLTDGGTLTKGSAWPSAGTKHVRLATVVTGGSTITSVTDSRVFARSAG